MVEAILQCPAAFEQGLFGFCRQKTRYDTDSQGFFALAR